MKVLITGANRGIGLELAKLYLKDGAHVAATARKIKEAAELKSLQDSYSDNLEMISLDVTEPASIDALKGKIAGSTIDILINNAGVLDKPANWLDLEAMNHSWMVNTLGPLQVIEACLPALQRSQLKKIVNVSSIMASIATTQPDNMPYRVSKAALNMATKMLSHQLRSDNICVVTLHPGWVKTDMGGPQAPTLPHESAAAIKTIIDPLTIEDSGRFLNALKPNKDIYW